MGGAVSSGRDNNELIDNLMGSNYIRTRAVERVFRALDRADYMTPEARDQAYKDLAWRNGPLHMSAPCIYSEVLEGLELKPGHSFLNVGSGTGYFSTLVGLIIGSSGVNHGVEVHSYVVEYAVKKLGQFIENSPTLDEFDFCEPKFYCGNGLCMAPLQAPYDRVYCGAGCPDEYQNYFKQLIKVGGILLMPLNDNLVQVKRLAVDEWSTRSVLNVSFATLRVPTKEEAADLIRLEEQCPARLQVLSRAVVRSHMRAGMLARHPHLREPPPRRPLPANACPRRICIPIEDDSDEGLNALHDLDHVNGANEMNALLSLVLSMGENRVAGALRFDSLDSPTDSSGEGDGDGGGGNPDDGDDGDDGDDHPDRPPPSETLPQPESVSQADRPQRPERPSRPAPADPRSQNDECSKPFSCHSLLTVEFQNDRKPVSVSHAATNTDDWSSSDTESKSEELDNIAVSNEVELLFGLDLPSTSRDMIFGGSVTEQKVDSSSEDETTEASKELKRKKLDSGIGEGTTTSSGSSPVKSESNCDESEADVVPSDNLSDDIDDENIGGRRRLQKRGRCALGPQSPSSTEHSGSGAESPSRAGRRRCKRRAGAEQLRPRRGVTDTLRPRQGAPDTLCLRYERSDIVRPRRGGADSLRPRRDGADARRVRLSILMKRGVKELPLPYALKKYVNLGRCFEF